MMHGSSHRSTTPVRPFDRQASHNWRERVMGTTSPRLRQEHEALLHLQRKVGNRNVQRMLMGTNHATTVQPHGFRSVSRALQSASGGGRPLPNHDRAHFEAAFGVDFRGVSVHYGPESDLLNHALDSRAFTAGRDIYFRKGAFDPGGDTGRALLAHELSHVVQQRWESVPSRMTLGPADDHHEREATRIARTLSRSRPAQRHSDGVHVRHGVQAARIQRDLVAYNKERTDVLAPMSPHASTTTFTMTSAEAPGIRAALSGLIAAGKITEITSKTGNQSWFAANHHKNVQLSEITKAFTDAGYALADKMARSLYDIHGEYLYSNQKITTVGMFLNRTSDLGTTVSTVRNRSMTEFEIRQARRVFKDAIDYTKVTISDGSVSAKVGSVGGYARTVGNTIYFPTGSSRSMAFMIHELTHVWQYQKTGWTYAPKALWAQITEGYSYTPKGKTPSQALNDARAAGLTLYDFNKEQQGDILADYFRRLQSGGDVSAYQPFIDDIK